VTNSSPKLVTIVIPAYAHQGMTENCVRKTIDTTRHRKDVEIIVADDSSPTPLTLDRELLDRARIVRTPTNLMFAGACNFAAKAALGEILVFLNNDTEPHAGWLDELIREMQGDTQIGVAGSRLLYRDGTIQHAGVGFSQRDGIPRHTYRGFPGDHPAVTRSRDFQAVTGACFAIRRDAFERAAGFDRTFINGYEDIDLCLKIRELGYRVRYCGSSVVTHHESVSRRGEIEGLRPEEDDNLRTFTDRWLNKTVRDEFNIYADDGLLWVDSGEIYPLVMRCAEELAVVGEINDTASLAALLNVRARQIFDLEKDVGYLMALLLDHGIDPR
jgi:GT2 family glycosyltransferase